MNVSVIVLGDAPPVLLVKINATFGCSPVVLNVISLFSLSPVVPKSAVLTGLLHSSLPSKSPE